MASFYHIYIIYASFQIQADNVNKISKANATNALVSGIAQGITSAAQTYLYGDLMKQNGNNYFMHGQNKGTSSQMGR
ncbi:MAG: hypothetical protein LBC92_05135 [Rickettsiales bacterium]|jgi:hypothetical protein|nr:hypothetical protein [Rickettsiales bacterium]